MKTKFLGLATILCAGFALQGANTLTMTAYDGSLVDQGSDVSPYTGTLIEGGTTTTGIKLYCDDAIDSAAALNSPYNINVSAVTGSLVNTRFGTATAAQLKDTLGAPNQLGNAGFGAVPTGTSLYQDLAWLFTQMQSYTGNNTELIGLQEAAWDLTSNSGPQDYSTTAKEWLYLASQYAGAGTATGSKLTDVGGVSLTVYAANYANWYVIDDVNAANKPQGGTGYQEFLAYAGTGITVTNTAGAPEPATFGLFGSALLFGAMIARRRRSSK